VRKCRTCPAILAKDHSASQCSPCLRRDAENLDIDKLRYVMVQATRVAVAYNRPITDRAEYLANLSRVLDDLCVAMGRPVPNFDEQLRRSESVCGEVHVASASAAVRRIRAVS
jgi:hypothetical protein